MRRCGSFPAESASRNDAPDRCAVRAASLVLPKVPFDWHVAGRGRPLVAFAGVCTSPRALDVQPELLMFDKRLRPSVEQKLRPVGANLRKSGVTADHLTLLGLVMAVGAAVAIANGALRLGFLLLGLSAVPDVLDGAVAKASGTSSPRGAFFDSVSDRISDTLVLGGVAWYLASTQGAHAALLPFAVLGASNLVSYERARAEALGFTASGGLMERAERMLLLGAGLTF